MTTWTLFTENGPLSIEADTILEAATKAQERGLDAHKITWIRRNPEVLRLKDDEVIDWLYEHCPLYETADLEDLASNYLPWREDDDYEYTGNRVIELLGSSDHEWASRISWSYVDPGCDDYCMIEVFDAAAGRYLSKGCDANRLAASDLSGTEGFVSLVQGILELARQASL